MCSCWWWNPEKRRSFRSLEEALSATVDPPGSEVSDSGNNSGSDSRNGTIADIRKKQNPNVCMIFQEKTCASVKSFFRKFQYFLVKVTAKAIKLLLLSARQKF